MLRVWNTLSRQLDAFQPLQPPRVGFYTCGPTVYNPVTLGNLRTYIGEDILKRVLLLLGYDVTHVMNITDVGHLTDDGDEGDDKVEREAANTGKNAWELARHCEQLFLRDLDRLNVLPATLTPRATEHIAEQITLIRALEAKGYTYQISDGLYFDTSKFTAYGRLSGQKLEDKEAGARVELNQEKHHPSDFALWKFSPPNSKRQMEWPSPWGIGFPGWHIECSAMSVKYLGQPFDIHTGGVDHIPVHHENEIAQSEAAYDKPLANYWLHYEFLLVDNGRMGKSLGNAYTLDNVIERSFDPLAYRYFCLGAHYRSKLNFTWEGLQAAQNALKNLYSLARGLPFPKEELAPDHPTWNAYREALEDDINTPKALAVLWDYLKSSDSVETKAAWLLKADKVLGLGIEKYVGNRIAVPPEIVRLAEERREARFEKDWARSDELRQRLEQQGWLIEDLKDGTYHLTPSE